MKTIPIKEGETPASRKEEDKSATRSTRGGIGVKHSGGSRAKKRGKDRV